MTQYLILTLDTVGFKVGFADGFAGSDGNFVDVGEAVGAFDGDKVVGSSGCL